ncbi:transport and Golgi organization protein 1-like [Ochlerotatus camptorhynchus]|uniref:transport and Golgi organization protein 1-like n=1 Tax=Ochlerotatus camptorhynchus TaxID=644619 RepID=UPI0031DE7CBB
MKNLNFACFVHISCLVLVLTVAGSSSKECGDKDCKTPIAKGYVTLRYMGGGGQKVNLAQGEKLLILGRNFGKDRDFLVQKADGKIGLASTKFVRESEILVRTKDRIEIPDVELQAQIDPSSTTEQNVIDGTTINNVQLTEKPTIEQEPAPVEEKTPDLEVIPTGSTINQEPTGLPTVNKETVETNPTEGKETAAVLEEEDEEGEDDEEEVEDEGDEGEDEAESETADQEVGSSTEQPVERPSEVLEEAKGNIVENLNQGEESVEIVEESQDSSETADPPATEESIASPENTSTVEPTATEAPVADEPAVPPTEVVEITTPSSVVEQPTQTSEPVEAPTTAQVVEETTPPIAVVDLREEIPVTEEPELIPEASTAASTNQNVIDEATLTPESALPQPPHGLLRGGLGSLLSHSHHHHHHHGHDHHHHHGHDHHHHNNQVEVNGNQLEPEKHEHELPFIGGIGQESLEELPDRKPLEKEPDSTSNEETVQHHGEQEKVAPVAPEDGYCDQQSCPQPNPAQPSPQHQHANGFHHSMVKDSANVMEEQQEPLQDETMSSSFVDNQEEEETDYAKMFIVELIKLSDLILLLGITSFTLIVFSLGHYLINKNRKEKPLIYKLNMVERDLMASHKENAMLKSDLSETKHKLISIENNSFGSNDMVIALRHELEDAEQAKLELQEQIASLEKELENAAEAGLELNKMVAELLNQSGSDSIALTVDELQRQLNEQQQTILSMNTTLADKSRENSELQITLGNQSAKFQQDMEDLQQALNDIKLEKNNMEIELNNIKNGQSSHLETFRKEMNAEIAKLNKEVKTYQAKWEEGKKALNSAEAKVEALEDCIKDIKRGNTGGTVDGLIVSAELKAQVAVLSKDKLNLQDQLQGEIVARQLLDDHVKIINEEISSLKKEFSQAEKDKLEAETRLEVLSSYFKDKETQLQKELSIKEAMWMQQQGETTSTVERIRLMQDEIQQLKSQNDKLRAEIEAQATAHKAQYTALETRSHDAWLAARQAERRLEESRNESSALRRKLTALGDASVNNSVSDGLMPNVVPPADMNLTAPSPIRVESPNAPPMMGLPPPPFMPPPFAPPFMPPFMPPPGPGEMRPAPLGRLMSPPPPNRYSPSLIDSRDRYTPERGRYSPDSRYDYSVMSNYETETDFSPPPSPPPHSRRSNYDRERDHHRSDRDHDLRDRDRDVRERDGRTSGSGGGVDRSGGAGGYPKAFSPPGMRTTSPPIQDPRNKKYQGGFSSGSQDSVATRKSGKQYKNSKPSA